MNNYITEEIWEKLLEINSNNYKTVKKMMNNYMDQFVDEEEFEDFFNKVWIIWIITDIQDSNEYKKFKSNNFSN